MDRGKLNFFDVSCKYECWKGKRVKSVLGESSSGVSQCPNEGSQSDVRAPSYQAILRSRGR